MPSTARLDTTSGCMVMVFVCRSCSPQLSLTAALEQLPSILIWYKRSAASSCTQYHESSTQTPNPNPNQATHPAAYEAVTKTMIHSPCGPVHWSSPCIKNGVCTKGYPKPFSEHTIAGPNRYPQYRCRNNGTTIRVAGRGHFEIDNRWVVPHNLYLAAKYGAHIDVESYTSATAVKYLLQAYKQKKINSLPFPQRKEARKREREKRKEWKHH